MSKKAVSEARTSLDEALRFVAATVFAYEAVAILADRPDDLPTLSNLSTRRLPAACALVGSLVAHLMLVRRRSLSSPTGYRPRNLS